MFLSQIQLRWFAQLLVDIGKIVVGTIVVGFFIPSVGVTLSVFVGGIILSSALFCFGLLAASFIK